MTYRLRQIPSERSTLSELADYMEVQCLISDEKIYSTTSGNSTMGVIYDNYDEDEYDNNDFEDDDFNFREALSEIEERNTKSNNNYPFISYDNVIKLKEDVNALTLDIYTFLLLATRENMNANKVANGLDGTALFEKLCAEVLHSYFGEKSEAFVFGTGGGNQSFQAKVEDFLNRLKEGLMFRRPDGDRGNQKDGKIDVVAFIPFADTNKGQFVAFGQCKTGTNWKGIATQLNPKSFCDSYITPAIGFTPIVVYMVSESFFEDWENTARNTGGILFDRSRIMNYLPAEISVELLNDIRSWNAGVLEKE